MQDVATTTSVLATGKPPQFGHHARGWQVSWLAGLDPREDRRVLLAFPGSVGNTKERTIRRKRGVQPRLIVLPPQWLFRPAVLRGRSHPTTNHLLKRQSGWRTLTAIQSRGRLRSACPVGVHAFAFPFALRTTSLSSGNHPSRELGRGRSQVNHGCGAKLRHCAQGSIKGLRSSPP